MPKITNPLVIVAAAIADTVKDMAPEPVPMGPLYMTLLSAGPTLCADVGGMDLDLFYDIVGKLCKHDILVRQGDCLVLGPRPLEGYAN